MTESSHGNYLQCIGKRKMVRTRSNQLYQLLL